MVLLQDAVMNLRPGQIRGFYAVLDQPSAELARSLLCCSPILQTRRKPATSTELDALARLGRHETALRGALHVVNDDIDLAHRVGADGVHLGQDDTPLIVARRRTDLFIGISTHDLGQLEAALADGADYVAFGPVFATRTKANPDDVVGLDALARAAMLAKNVPLVAIGGITPDRVDSVAQAGAAAACVISAVNSASNIQATARAIAHAFER